MDIHVVVEWMGSPPSSLLWAGRAGRKEKINAWHLNECGECWIDRNSKLGQQDCLFKGQDPLIIVLAEIDSQTFTVPLLTCCYLQLIATRPTKHTLTCRNARLPTGYLELDIDTNVPTERQHMSLTVILYLQNS